MYNEASSIYESIITLHQHLLELDIDFEILICNNGSDDDTEIIANELIGKFSNIKFSSDNKRGIGIGIRAGIEHAKKDYIMFYAVDLPFGLEIIKNSIQACDGDKQLIIGSKYHLKSRTKFIFKRYLASRVYNLILNLLFNTEVRDSQGSLLFSNKEIKRILNYLDSDSPFLQTQILIYLKLFGNQVKEIPVNYLYYRKESKIRIIKDGIIMFRELIREIPKYKRIIKQNN